MLYPRKYIMGKLSKYMETPEEHQSSIDIFERELVNRRKGMQGQGQSNH